MRDNKYLTKIIAGSLLGDGYVSNITTVEGNSRFELSQVIDHIDYIDWFADRLESITSINTHIVHRINNGVNVKPQKVLKTKQHPFYTKFRHRMYANGYKTVDPHYLTLLDAEMLAIWYMDDGSLALNTKNSQASVYLYTDSFSYGDNLILREALKEKTGFIWNIHKRQSKQGHIKYRLYLYKKQNELFFEYIQPFVLPSFQYKMSIHV